VAQFRGISEARHDEAYSSMPGEEPAKVIREMPRDPEIIEMLRKFSGVASLPSR
jgi:hypothetical protein